MSNEFEPTGGVVVGINGSEQGYAAARYAAGEADRLGVRLDLVHVLPASLPVDTDSTTMASPWSLQSYGTELLEHARKSALEVRPALEVETHLPSGSRSQELVRCAEHARMIVLGNPSPRAFDRVWTGGPVTTVARRSACPVVVVPADWEQTVVHGRIAVGVKTPGDAGTLYDAAFSWAAELEADLVVLHAWRLEGVYDDIIADRAGAERWQHIQAALIERDLSDVRGRFPGVPVRVYVRHEDPAHALVRVTGGVDRVLIQRPSSGGSGHHLGRVARAVLRDAHCAVVVLPEQRAEQAPVVDHRAGELVR